VPSKIAAASRPTQAAGTHETKRFDIETLPGVNRHLRIPIVRMFGGNALQVWQANAGLPQFLA
jgi:hypothetical protein